MKKTVKITVTATYETSLWSAVGVKNDIRETFKDLEGIKVKIGAALSRSIITTSAASNVETPQSLRLNRRLDKSRKSAGEKGE